MALKFTDRRWHEDALGTVTFPAWAADARVPCRITDEALMYVFGANGTHSSLIEAFDKNRAQIRAAAAWKYEAAGEAVQITIVSADFEPKAEKKKPEPEPTGQSEILMRLAQFRRAFHRAPSAPLPSVSSAELAALDDAFADLDAALAAEPEGESVSGETEQSQEELCAALD